MKDSIIVRYLIAFLFFIRNLCRRRKHLRVLSSVNTVRLIKEKKLSVSRFGDGELKIMRGGSIGFQCYDVNLSCRLREVIQEHRDNLLICVPRFLTNMDNISNEVKTFWKYSLLRNQNAWDYYLEESRIYGDTQFTRFYMDLKDKSSSANIIEEIKSLWRNRNVVIVEGEESRLGVGNDLFNDSSSVKRIICPAENAFCYYERILCETKKMEKDNLFIIALGPTATVLAYDLSREGFQAIDMGHIDIEYEWFLRQSSSKIAITGKYVNECHTRGGSIYSAVYQSQIIAVID